MVTYTVFLYIKSIQKDLKSISGEKFVRFVRFVITKEDRATNVLKLGCSMHFSTF